MKHKLIYVKTDKNGTKYYHDITCTRCGGLGGCDNWKFTGWTCYKCGGSGITPLTPQVVKVYTPEYEAKLKAQREKRAAKKEAELRAKAQAERQEWIDEHFPEGKIYVVTGDTYKIYEDLKAAGAKYSHNTGWYFKYSQDKYPTVEMTFEECTHESCAGFLRFNNDIKQKAEEKAKALKPESQFIGKIGDKITVEAKHTHSAWFESKSPYTHRIETTYIHNFETPEGNVLTWKTGSYPEISSEKLTITGTVKEHSEYKGVKQTVLTRCKIQG